MTINDLEVGQFVKLKNGDIYIIGLSVNSRLFKEKKYKLILIDICHDGRADSIVCYSNEMTHYNGDENLTIVQVANDYNFKDVIWTRDDMPILTDKEREYLRAVIKPFRDKVVWIIKMVLFEREFITINLNVGIDTFSLPSFEENEYYKGMVVGKRYTLEELGL